MDSAPSPRRRSPHVRCRFCGRVLPGWLPVPDVPDGALLLPHLANWHLSEAKPYLRRMETEDIATVVMELFERVPGDRAGEEKG